MTTAPLFSAHWHRVRDVRPRLADDVAMTRHVYRGRVYRVLQRRATNAWHRLDEAGYALVGRLDGQRTVGEIWERTLLERDREAPTQDEWMSLLATLHAADLVVVERRVPAEDLFERRDAMRERERRQRWLNPLYLRIRLADPDPWLERVAPLATAFFSRTAGLLWCALTLMALVVLFANGPAFVAAIADPSLLSAQSAVLFVLVYPVLKLAHELGHALALKRRGARVPEIGIALMVLMPLPYVDASASAAFPDKRDRMLVDAAGVLVELAGAAIGVLLWATGAGIAADVGLVLALTGGASTVLVNGNPLMKFDGYHLLADTLEIPNLAARARRESLGRVRGWLTGDPYAGEPGSDAAECAWLLAYGFLSGPYRTGLTLWIAWMVSDRWFVLGTVLAAYAIGAAVLLPSWKAACALTRDPDLAQARPRAIAVLVPLACVGLFAALPFPHASVTRGVVWLPDEAVVRAAGTCEITRVASSPGSDVRIGDELFVCSDPELILRERELLARLDELDVQLTGIATRDPVGHARLAPDRRATVTALDDVRARRAQERRVAAVSGRFDVAGSAALEGRALERGEIAGYVVPPEARTVRVAIDEHDIGRVDAADGRVEIRLANAAGKLRTHATTVLGRTPRASFDVPSAGLSTQGGGDHPSDPAGDGRRLLAPVYDVELAWPDAAGTLLVGAHVDVRFVHGTLPLGARLVGRLRQALVERTRT